MRSDDRWTRARLARGLLARAVAAGALAAAGIAAAAGGAAAGAAPGASAAQPTPEITGGAPDGDAHPFVATVLAPSAPKPNCSGVLVRGDTGVAVLLTDAHCVAGGGARSGAGVGFDFAPAWTSSTPLLRGDFFVDPLFRPGTTGLHDLAVVVLPSGTAPAPATLATAGQADVPTGTALTVVGTGMPYPGQRRAATEVVQQVTAAWIVLGPGTGNSCDGDSGGPDLLPSSATVVALTDEGTCTADQDTRVDTAEAHWLVTAAATVDVPAGLREPSLLGMAAVRHGGVVVVGGASKYLDITTSRWLGWVGNPVQVQRWSRGTWITIGHLTTDGLGHGHLDLRIPFRVGLRLVCGSIISVQGAVSAPAIR